MGIFSLFFNNKSNKSIENKKTNSVAYDENLMTSQYAALYLKSNNQGYRNAYIQKLIQMGISKKDAEIIFDFECGIIQKFNKEYLLSPDFTQLWFFGLRQPFFRHYPKTQEEVYNECYLTISEICKMIDEAEWHYWNSHEKISQDDVWEEICTWRLGGTGRSFASKYFEMIENRTGASIDSIGKLVSEQGTHLSKYKWK